MSEVMVAVEGTVVDWEHETQINPNTGEVFDFYGQPLKPEAIAEPESHIE